MRRGMILFTFICLSLVSCTSGSNPDFAEAVDQARELEQEALNLLKDATCENLEQAGSMLVKAQGQFRAANTYAQTKKDLDVVDGEDADCNTNFNRVVRQAVTQNCCWSLEVIVQYLEENPNQDDDGSKIKLAKSMYFQSCPVETAMLVQ